MIPGTSALILPPLSPVTIGMAKLTRDDIETILQEWQTRLNLGHWRISIKWDEKIESEDEADAEFLASDWYDEASIRLNPNWPDWDRREANVTIVHELCHLIQRDICTCVDSLKPKIAKSVWQHWSDGWFQTVNEKTVEHLAQAFVDLGGVV